MVVVQGGLLLLEYQTALVVVGRVVFFCLLVAFCRLAAVALTCFAEVGQVDDVL